MIPHVVLCLVYIPTRKDGVPEFVIKALYCLAVVYITSDTISEITSVVISQMGISTPLHDNIGRILVRHPFSLVRMQDIGYNVSFNQSLYSFSNLLKFFIY